MSYRELLIGCGDSRDKRVTFPEIPKEWQSLTTLDVRPATGADVLHDLNVLPYPFDDNTFDEIHAYECLEHCGRQGDAEFFFAQFSEFFRILKPGGYLCGTVPMWDSPWAWGDPSHTRVITPGALSYLDQDHYTQQYGKTSTSDFRHIWKGDFKVTVQETEHQLGFVLKANK